MVSGRRHQPATGQGELLFTVVVVVSLSLSPRVLICPRIRVARLGNEWTFAKPRRRASHV
jgi:hypothetical protein